MLVAMKGHPGTGKSTIARSLGRALQWPVLDKDDIRDCSLALQAALPPASAAALLNSFSYLALWRLAHTQLQLGLSIVVDCPLSRPSLFSTASALAHLHRKRLVIIECVAANSLEWNRRLEARAAELTSAGIPQADEILHEVGTSGREHAASSLKTWAQQEGDGLTESGKGNDPQSLEVTDEVSTSERDESDSSSKWVQAENHEGDFLAEIGSKGWHKPACWEDLQALIAGYQGCWEYDTAAAKKLIVNTTSLSCDAVESSVLDWIGCVTDDTPAVSYLP